MQHNPNMYKEVGREFTVKMIRNPVILFEFCNLSVTIYVKPTLDCSNTASMNINLITDNDDQTLQMCLGNV